MIGTEPKRLSDNWCRLIKRFLFSIIEYPCQSYSVLASKLAQIKTSDPNGLIQDEVDEYTDASTSNRSKYRRALITTASLAYAIKNLYVPWVTVSNIDFNNIYSYNSSNIRRIDETTFQLVCIKTNCTQFLLTGTGKTLDIRHFPIIPTCHPFMNLIYPPTTHLGPYAMFLHTLVSFVALLLGVVVPLHQLRYPCRSDSLMFVVAPRLTRSLMGLRVKELYLEYNDSLKSYLKAIDDKNTFRSSSADRYLSIMRKRGYLNQIRHEIQLHFSEYKVSIDSENCLHMCWNELVEDCLPIVRSSWWLARARRILITVFSASIVSFLIEAGLIVADVIQRSRLKILELSLMEAEMLRSGCRPWVEIAPNVKLVLPPGLMRLNFNPLTLLDNGILLVLVMILPCLAANYYLVDRELTCWRLELQNQLRVLCEITRIHQLQSSLNLSSGPEMQLSKKGNTCPRHGTLSVDSLHNRKLGRDSIYKQIFFECNSMDRLMFRTSPMERQDSRTEVGRFSRTELNGKVATQQVVLKALSELELTSDSFLNLLEKMYISFRLFMEHVRHCSDTTAPLAFISLGLSYGLVIIVVWHSRLMYQFSYEHMLVVVVTCVWSILITVLISNFHAKVSLPSVLMQDV